MKNPPVKTGGFFFDYTFLNMYIHGMRNLFVFIALTWSHLLFAQQNISLLSHFSYSKSLSNVWGYTDETNVEYALVGVEDGFSIVSLANPSNPVEISKIAGTLNSWREIKTYGDYAYVSSESGDGLLIVDLTPLPTLTTLNYVYKKFNTAQRAHTLYIDEKGFLYLFGTDRNQETIILDLKADPMNPTEVGSTNLYYAHDGIVKGDSMYLAHINNGFVGVYNISDRSNPQLITTFNTPLRFSHNIALSSDGKYLFATDEKAGSYLAAYDISDFNNIFEIDRFQRNGKLFSMVHNAHMKEGYLVNSYYLEGINIVDAHDPKNLVEVGFYDTTPNDSGYVFQGVWGVYPYFNSQIIVASDMAQGLFVFSPNYQRACYVSGSIKDLNNNSPLNNVKVRIANTDIEANSDISGIYHSGYGFAGNKTLLFSKSGYYDTSIVVDFVVATNQVTNVFMRKKPTVHMVFKVVDKNNSIIANPKFFIESEDDSWVFTGQSNGVLVVDLAGLDFKITAGKWNYESACSLNNVADFKDTIIYILQSGIYDDFTFDFSWSTVGAANKGGWVRELPYGTFFSNDTINPAFDAANDCNGFAFVTGNSKNPDFTFNKVEQIKTELISPSFDLSQFTNPHLSLYLWFNDYDRWQFANDSAFLIVFNNNETVALDTIVGSTYAGKAKWNKLEYDLSIYNLNFSNYQFKIITQDILPHNALELGVDVFQLKEKSAQNTKETTNEIVEVYPNPCSALVNIKSTADLSSCIITDVQGKIVFKQEISMKNITEIHVESLSSGVYFLELINSENLRHVEKLVVVHP